MYIAVILIVINAATLLLFAICIVHGLMDKALRKVGRAGDEGGAKEEEGGMCIRMPPLACLGGAVLL